MKKNGFTLIELTGAIILLSLIVLVAFPAIVNVVKSSDNKINEAVNALIISASKTKVEQEKNSYPLTNGNIYCVTIKTLIDESYLISDLQDGTSGEELDVNKFVKITVEKSKYKFNIADTCTELKK